jgi:hypothetical protein
MYIIGLNLAMLAYQVIELGDMYWLHITHYHLERHICKIEGNINYQIVTLTLLM